MPHVVARASLLSAPPPDGGLSASGHGVRSRVPQIEPGTPHPDYDPSEHCDAARVILTSNDAYSIMGV
jgi:hypothetical protein